MRVNLRLLAGCIAVACAVSFGSVAKAALFTVASSPPAPANTAVSIDVGPGITTIGPLAITDDPGLDADVTAPITGPPWMAGTGDGTLTFNGGELAVQDVPTTTLDLGLGTVDLTMTGVGLSIVSTAIPVVGNEWDIDTIGAPSALTLALNQGTILLNNPTGLIALFLTEDVNLDLTADPLEVELADLLGAGLGGTADASSIFVNIPAIAIPVLTVGTSSIDVVLGGGVYVETTIPEPATIAMLGVGLVGLAAVGIRRRRKA